MKKKLAMKWVEALRSGKYEQGSSYLECDNKFCCLGVLCKVMGVEGTRVEVNTGGYKVEFDGDTAGLTTDIQKIAGMKESFGLIDYLHTRLSELNDTGYRDDPYQHRVQMNFDEIADIIQICYKDL